MKKHPKIEWALFIIAEKFNTALSLEEISNSVELSKFHFLRLFKRETNSTFNSYLHRLRIENAIHLFKIYPNISISDVAHQCGYTTSSEFSRVFRKFKNLTPSQFQKSITELEENVKAESFVELPVVYVQKIKLNVLMMNYINSDLESNALKLITDISQKNELYGVFIDTPIHIHPEQCAYYLGSENEIKNLKTYKYEIEEGLYTYFEFQGDFNSFREKVIAFKTQKIDQSRYEIGSFVAFEKIEIPANSIIMDYGKLKRQLFIKVQRKKQYLHSFN